MTTIAEQVTQLKQDFDEVAQEQFRVGYNEGEMKGWDDGYDSAEAEYKPQIETSYQKGVTDGKEAERNEFWYNQFLLSCPDPMQPMRAVGPYEFHGWNMLNFKPTENLRLGGATTVGNSSAYAFAYTAIVKYTPGQNAVRCTSYDLVKLLEDHGVSLATNPANRNLSYLFYSSTVSRVPAIDLSTATTIGYMFNGCTELVTIEGLTVSESTPVLSCFGSCSKLNSLTITGTIAKGGANFSSCTALSHDSLMSIINALKDYSGTTSTYKIIIGSTNIGKLAPEELDQIEAKGWTYA